jgi:hypothetical protein
VCNKSGSRNEVANLLVVLLKQPLGYVPRVVTQEEESASVLGTLLSPVQLAKCLLTG